ncbi:hypothetical protein Gotri_016006 [Gossypium trilobum]|uniref:Uncharacterized protein n=1 Tax=Gossypium trilobum TaxID=34281 RepID=A0A7J9E1Z7_9ROSI|nr:hypothetical protein [Gossypium trilobum]
MLNGELLECCQMRSYIGVEISTGSFTWDLGSHWLCTVAGTKTV